MVMQVPTGRSEKRMLKAVGVTARLSDGSSLPEGTFTENISMRGARIVTKTQLRPGGMLEVHFRSAEIPFQSRVVYCQQLPDGRDRKSTRLNSSHVEISYAVFCLKKKKKKKN